jgi:Protein of unknown function (DUF5818)
MTRETSSLAAFALLTLSAPLVFSQGVQRQPSPVPPFEILGPQLIAWSQVQKPRPVPAPLPPPDRPVQSEQQTGPAASQTPQEPAPQPPTAQTLTGTIIKDGGRYLLKVSSSTTTYELDDQERAKRYEGKQVKVVGALSATGNSFHIVSIELIS